MPWGGQLFSKCQSVILQITCLVILCRTYSEPSLNVLLFSQYFVVHKCMSVLGLVVKWLHCFQCKSEPQVFATSSNFFANSSKFCIFLNRPESSLSKFVHPWMFVKYFSHKIEVLNSEGLGSNLGRSCYMRSASNWLPYWCNNTWQ